MESKNVDMIRLARPEEVYDREELFGRDVGDVFKKKASDGAAASTSVIENKKFISESELEEIKKQRGASALDDSVGPMKPLSEVLRENKAAKDEEFKNVWKSMKVGKNRPLDGDELAYYDQLAQDEANRDLRRRKEEEMELEEFRKQAQASLQDGGEGGLSVTVGPSLPPSVSLKRPAPVSIKPLLKIKPKEITSKKGDDEPASKKAKGANEEEEGNGLMGLLADYGEDESTSS